MKLQRRHREQTDDGEGGHDSPSGATGLHHLCIANLLAALPERGPEGPPLCRGCGPSGTRARPVDAHASSPPWPANIAVGRDGVRWEARAYRSTRRRPNDRSTAHLVGRRLVCLARGSPSANEAVERGRPCRVAGARASATCAPLDQDSTRCGLFADVRRALVLRSSTAAASSRDALPMHTRHRPCWIVPSGGARGEQRLARGAGPRMLAADMTRAATCAQTRRLTQLHDDQPWRSELHGRRAARPRETRREGALLLARDRPSTDARAQTPPRRPRAGA